MRFRRILLSVVAVLSLGTVAATVPAQAASPQRSAAAHSAASEQRTGHVDQSALAKSMAAHHGVLTAAEAGRLGVRPNTVYLDTPQIRAAATSATSTAGSALARAGGVLQPMSHTGCNGDVCIEVEGTKLWVDDWNTWAFPPEEYCSYAMFWQDGELAFTGADLCGTYMETDATMETDYDNHTHLCNTWSGIAGKPCAEVHS